MKHARNEAGVTGYPAPFSCRRSGNLIIVENAFARWEHDLARGGELVGAFVKNGTGGNLLVAPQTTSLCTWVRGGWRQYHFYDTSRVPASAVETSVADDGSVTLRFDSGFADAAGKVLEGACARHAIRFSASGAATHELDIILDRDMDFGHVRIGTLSLRDDMDRIAVRPCSQAAWAVELQNPCQWIDLVHAKSRTDLPAYRSRYLPLSILFVKNGIEAIEMSLGDDLAAWDNFGNDFPGLAQGSVCELRDPWRYEAVFAPLDSPRAGNIVHAGTYRFTYRLSLPFVRESIVPLSLAGGFIKHGEAFEERWPTADELNALADYGVRLMRIHNDGDAFGNGIFWRDVDYPPYPPDEMAKMDRAIADANAAGIDVVPYFSCKEWHPEAKDFAVHAETCAHRVVPGEKFMETFFGTSLFGVQMCLESDWFGVRRDSIDEVLSNHAFKGMYYDWCMGQECINAEHGGGRHWDNDKLLDLVEWSRTRTGDVGKLYLHLTNVPSLAIENLGDMILVEESEYFEIFPEMFTPQVHFLNVAPRSICVMLPGESRTSEKMRALALAALLHHATLCIDGLKTFRDVLELYRSHKADFEAFTRYSHHSAPGEGLVSTGGSREVGMSVYWKDGEILGVLANLTPEARRTAWSVKLDGRTFRGETDVPPLDFVTFPVIGNGE